MSSGYWFCRNPRLETRLDTMDRLNGFFRGKIVFLTPHTYHFVWWSFVAGLVEAGYYSPFLKGVRGILLAILSVSADLTICVRTRTGRSEVSCNNNSPPKKSIEPIGTYRHSIIPIYTPRPKGHPFPMLRPGHSAQEGNFPSIHQSIPSSIH